MKHKLIIMAAAFALCGCSPRTYAPMLYQVDTTRQSNLEIVVVRDSVFIMTKEVIREKGDTVFVTRTETKYRDRYRDREVRDTLYVDKVREITKTEYIEKPLTRLQSAQIFAGRAFILLLAGCLVWAVIRIIKKFHT